MVAADDARFLSRAIRCAAVRLAFYEHARAVAEACLAAARVDPAGPVRDRATRVFGAWREAIDEMERAEVAPATTRQARLRLRAARIRFGLARARVRAVMDEDARAHGQTT